MHNKSIIFVVFLAALITISVSAADSDRERKEGTHFTNKVREYSEGDIVLLPEFSLSEKIRLNIESHETTFLVEFLFTLPSLPDEYNTLDSIAALLLDVDSLEGIEYWSGGRGRMHPYIKKSYRVEALGSKTALPPANPAAMGRTVDFIQYQKDTSFGSNWYSASVMRSEDAILMTTVNLTELKSFTKKTSDAGGVLMQIAVIPGSSDVQMYIAMALKEFPPIGWSQGGVAGSFNHRISALEAWFADKVYGVE